MRFENKVALLVVLQWPVHGLHLQVFGGAVGNGMAVEEGRGVTVSTIGENFLNGGDAEGFENDIWPG
jgi:hypothetical protein